MTRNALVLSSILTCTTFSVFAQEDDESDSDKETEDEVRDLPRDPSAPAPEVARKISHAPRPATHRTGPFTLETYPSTQRLRPLTLPSGVVEARVFGGYDKTTTAGPPELTTKTYPLDVAFEYGFDDQLELAARTAFDLNTRESSRVFHLGGAFSFIDTEKLDVALRAFAALNFNDAEGIKLFDHFAASADTRFLLGEKLYFYGGQDILVLHFSPKTTTSVNLDAGLGYDIRPKLGVRADATWVHFGLGGVGNDTATFVEHVPIRLQGLYVAKPWLDILVEIQIGDLFDPANHMQFLVGAAARL